MQIANHLGRTTCGTKSFSISLRLCSAALPFGRLEMAHSPFNCDYLPFSTLFSLLLAVSIKCSRSSCITATSLRLVRRRLVITSALWLKSNGLININLDSPKPITGLPSLALKLSLRSLISSSAPRSISFASTLPPDFRHSPASLVTFIFK